MRILLLTFVFSLLRLAVSGAEPYHIAEQFEDSVEWNESDGIIYKDISYGDKEINKYDLYIPANHSRKDDVGVVLFIHGGGWAGGDKMWNAPECKIYAKAGYITASMNYSLLGTTENYSIFKVLDEIQSCIADLKTELENKGYNVTRLALDGGSAGAHLSSLYTNSRADISTIPIVLVINKSGPIDMHLLYPQLKEMLAEADSNINAEFIISSMVGKAVTDEQIKNGLADNILDSISPNFYINSNSTPSLLFYGAKDPLVIHGEKLAITLEEAGIDYQYRVFPDLGHGLTGDQENTDERIKTTLAYIKKYFGY
ncbi:MAG: alpha/beta hydrolase [Bacteroidales bacterium]|nr:alpha/beta hydrolase [Bacteroidales bacterium]